MKLYLLRPIKQYEGPWDPWYDKSFGIMVRANSPTGARRVATEACGDEGPEPWLDANLTSCREVKYEGKQGIIIVDFRSA